MIPWEHLDTAYIPGDPAELALYRRDTEYSIRLKRCELMNSRVHGSEEALAELACERIANRPEARVLIGGLGMGFSVRAALDKLRPNAEVVVAELVSKVVDWNRGPLADLSGRCLEDRRVTVRTTDVANIIRAEKDSYDAILLDVDNGPEGLTRESNDWLYAPVGLKAAHDALRGGGVLAVWSCAPSKSFVKRLHKAGFQVDEESLKARGRKGSRHIIWLAAKR